jgi:hypothetical protein
MVDIGGEEKLPAIKVKLPASIISFDLSSALLIAKRHVSSFTMRKNETYVLENVAMLLRSQP